MIKWKRRLKKDFRLKKAFKVDIVCANVCHAGHDVVYLEYVGILNASVDVKQEEMNHEGWTF
jgi:hypothetical protein